MMTSEYTWKELETRFNDLAPNMKGTRLDITWGSVPQQFHISGCGDNNSLNKFYTLSTIAGKKLINSIDKLHLDDKEEFNDKSNPLFFWYQALKEFSGEFQVEFIGDQKDSKTGESLGAIYSGKIRNIADVSSVQCMKFSIALPAKEEYNTTKPLNAFWDKYAVPVIVSVVASVIAGIILLFI